MIDASLLSEVTWPRVLRVLVVVVIIEDIDAGLKVLIREIIRFDAH